MITRFTILAACLSFTVSPALARKAELFADAGLTIRGLSGSYVAGNLAMVADSADWRQSQRIAGTRIDPDLDFSISGWGQRESVGLGPGNDGKWADFSVQWDGWIKVETPGQRFFASNDNGSRMWIDLNRDGRFGDSELLDGGWGKTRWPKNGERSPALAAGSYPVRIQFHAGTGGGEFHLLTPALVPRQFIESPGNPRLHVRALMISYEPRVPSRENQRLWEVMNWPDPGRLARQFKADLEYATGGAIDIEIIEERRLDEFPVFTDGFRYNPEQYLKNRERKDGWHTASRMDFYAMARDHGLEKLVNSGEINEIWVFGGPQFEAFGECWMTGPNAFYVNGPIFPDIGFHRAIAGYGFNYERGVAEMVHNLGHRTENHGQRAFGKWNLAAPSSAFDHFSANYKNSPGRLTGVGNCHFPANADADYDYSDPRVVESSALDWPNYPKLAGAKSQVGHEIWSTGPTPDSHRDYMSFYFGMIPRNAGTDRDGRQNNWFKYIWDYNSYEADTGLPRSLGAFAAGSTIPLPGAVEHSFTVCYYDTEGIDRTTLGDGNVKVLAPDGKTLPVRLHEVGVPCKTSSGFSLVATYRVAAPSGTWKLGDNGRYSIVVEQDQVRNQSGKVLTAGSVGSFVVNIPNPSCLDIPRMVASGHAKISHSPIDIGPISNLFDQNPATIIRTPAINPAVVTIEFKNPQLVHRLRTNFTHPGLWTIETANSLAELESRSGSWRVLIDAVESNSEHRCHATLSSPVTATVWRLTVKRTSGDNYVHIMDWELLGPDESDDIPPTATATSGNVTTAGGTAQFIQVDYRDNLGVEPTTISPRNLQVTGPNGFSVIPALHDLDAFFPGPQRTARYWLVPPGGSWDSSDNGTYQIQLRPDSVLDLSGNAANEGTIGSFQVFIPQNQ